MSKSKFSAESRMAPKSPIVVDLKHKLSDPPVEEVSGFILNEILQSNYVGLICIQVAVTKKQKHKVENSLLEFADEYGNGSTSVQMTWPIEHCGFWVQHQR